MNILFLHKQARVAARFHSDQDIGSKIIEYVHLMSTVANLLNGKRMQFYESSNEQHSHTKWASKCYANFHWLWCTTMYLNEEHSVRFGDSHKSWRMVDRKDMITRVARMFVRHNKWLGSITKPPVIVPKSCKIGTVVDSYQAYYKLMLKKNKYTWTGTKRKVPKWLS